MNSFFAKINGFNPEYAKFTSAKIEKGEEEKDDFDYSDVDFCQGDTMDVNDIFGNLTETRYNNHYDKEDSIFNFD